MSEYMTRLAATAETIDISRLGALSVHKPKWISPRRMQSFIRYIVAQALLDNIAQSEDRLAVRNIFPKHDLLDANGDLLQHDNWYQPTGGGGYMMNDSVVELYQTNINCRNTQKVYLLYGFKNLKYFTVPHGKDEVISTQSETGPYALNLSSLRVLRGHVMLIDIPDLSVINDIGYVFFQNPIIYKRGDDMAIQGMTKGDAMGKSDNLKLQCIIAEALGAHVTG